MMDPCRRLELIVIVLLFSIQHCHGKLRRNKVHIQHSEYTHLSRDQEKFRDMVQRMEYLEKKFIGYEQHVKYLEQKLEQANKQTQFLEAQVARTTRHMEIMDKELERQKEEDFKQWLFIQECHCTSQQMFNQSMSNVESLKDKRLLVGTDHPTTVPRHVAFSSYLDHQITNLGPEQIIPYNKILLNEGGAYSELTGVFTAPVSGVYLFTWTVGAKVMPGVAGHDIWIKLVVNNVYIATAVAETIQIGDDEQGGNSVILRVNAGDKVWIAHYGGKHIYSLPSERISTFSGVLLF